LANLAGDERLLQVETVLAHSMYDRLPAWLRLVLRWIRSWTKPWIGVLRHHEPKPLTVPASYLHTAPPEPAPTITIVTPSFEQGTFLDRTIYSVVSQNYPALEYVVQDGGSSDETLVVLRRFESLLMAWRSEPDEGQADAINRGFRDTTGEIMGWLNSDDLLLPGALAYVAQYFSDHPDVDVVYGHRLMIDEDDGHIGSWILPAHDDLALTLADYVPQETLFWRRRIWEAAGGLVDPHFRFALDWDLLLRFRAAGAKIVRVPRFVGAFRVHARQKTTVDSTVGRIECDRLRQRVHGRRVSIDEALLRLKPYLNRHVRIHAWLRLRDALPLRRTRIVTMPPEPFGLAEPHAASTGEKGEAALISPLAPVADPNAGSVDEDFVAT
jgi:GT2 family glycosyltransferase